MANGPKPEPRSGPQLHTQLSKRAPTPARTRSSSSAAVDAIATKYTTQRTSQWSLRSGGGGGGDDDKEEESPKPRAAVTRAETGSRPRELPSPSPRRPQSPALPPLPTARTRAFEPTSPTPPPKRASRKRDHGSMASPQHYTVISSSAAPRAPPSDVPIAAGLTAGANAVIHGVLVDRIRTKDREIEDLRREISQLKYRLRRFEQRG
ncbi:hypothetical protein Hte_005864 [Hypoxylon texense]